MKSPPAGIGHPAAPQQLIISGSGHGARPVYHHRSVHTKKGSPVEDNHLRHNLDTLTELEGAILRENPIGTLNLDESLYCEDDDSIIFRATPTARDDPGRAFVVKMQSTASRAGVEQFENEVAILRAIGPNPHIVRVLYATKAPVEVNVPGGGFANVSYCILEVLGKPVAELESRVEPSTLVKMARQGLMALQAVHQAGYVHGDVHGGNFPFTTEYEFPIKLIDFGLARRVSADPGRNPLDEYIANRIPLSVSELTGHFQSRKDDLHRFGETVLNLLNGEYSKLFIRPRGAPRLTIDEIVGIKMGAIPSECCGGDLIPGMDEYFAEVRAMQYADEPNYAYLLSLFPATEEELAREAGAFAKVLEDDDYFYGEDPVPAAGAPASGTDEVDDDEEEGGAPASGTDEVDDDEEEGGAPASGTDEVDDDEEEGVEVEALESDDDSSESGESSDDSSDSDSDDDDSSESDSDSDDDDPSESDSDFDEDDD